MIAICHADLPPTFRAYQSLGVGWSFLEWESPKFGLVQLVPIAFCSNLGGVAFSPEHANRMVETSYRMIFLDFDWSLLQKRAASVFNGIQR